METVGTARLIAGNVISFIACIILVISGYVKDKNKTIMMQNIQMGLSGVVCLFLNAMSGAVTNFLCLPRNVLAQKNKLTLPAKIIFSAALLILTFFFNTKGAVGWLPILPTIIYTFFLDRCEGAAFKLLVIFLMTFWVIHNAIVGDYVSTVFSTLNIVTSAIAVYRIKHEKAPQEEAAS